MTRKRISLPSLAVIVIVRARLDITGCGNGPSPRRRAARIAAAPTIHHSGSPASYWVICASSFAVSGSIAASRNNAESNRRSVDPGILLEVILIEFRLRASSVRRG